MKQFERYADCQGLVSVFLRVGRGLKRRVKGNRLARLRLVSVFLRVGRGLKLDRDEGEVSRSRFGLPSGGPRIETASYPGSNFQPKSFGLPSGGPRIETFGAEYNGPQKGFGLPSGGPRIETGYHRAGQSPDHGVCCRHEEAGFGLPSGGPRIETPAVRSGSTR